MEEKKKKEIRNFSQISGGDGMARSALNSESMKRFNVTEREIKNAIDSKNVSRLREISQYFYHASGTYRRLVDYYGTLLTFDHLLYPMVKEEDLSQNSFLKALEEKKNYIQKSNIKETSSEITKIVVRDGAYFGYERELNEAFSFQTLPSNYCRSRFKILGVYAVEFNYEYFRNFTGTDLEEILDAFPEEMQMGYVKYLQDPQNERWQILNPEFARVHMLTDEIPMLSSLFPDLIEYEDVKALEKIKNELDIYKVIVQKIPMTKDGELTFDLEELKQFHKNLRKAVTNSHIDVVTTPCDVEAVDLKDKVETMKDNTERARNTVYSTSGTSSILFSSGAKGSSIGLEESIRVDENLVLPLLHQFERWYDQKFSHKNKKYKFKLYFLPVTSRNREKMVAMYMNAASSGYPTKLLTISAMGIDQDSGQFLLDYENVFLKLNEKMVPTKSSHTASASNETNGRPESDESELSDEGLRQRDKED